MGLELRAKEILSSSEYINIATASAEGVPWNTPVTGVHDQELNFYWSSWNEATHSNNISVNPSVFITLYDSTRKRGDNHRRCFYLQGEAAEVSKITDIEIAISLLYQENSKDRNSEIFLGDTQRKIYKAVPRKVWLNDVSERELTKETVKMRVEVSLKKLKGVL